MDMPDRQAQPDAVNRTRFDITPQSWARVRELLAGTVERPAEDRARFLDDACGDVPALRLEVESLLEAHLEADNFLNGISGAMAVRLLEPGPDAPAADSRVGPYRILQELGRGGMGVVYLAHDERLDRRVALKLLPPYLADDITARQRLREEARTLGSLDHPNIAVIHEIEETEQGQLFMAMAHYDGETLQRRLERGMLPVSELLTLAVHVGEGLAAAHGRGIVHRDIKPSNIVMTGQGVPKIVDFGIALALDAASTNALTAAGTAAYMSPEQATRDSVDHRTDIWSFGVVLYEALTGSRPLDGEPPRGVLKSLRPDLPSGLARTIDRCLRTEPDARFQEMGEVVAELRRVQTTLTNGRAGRVPGAARWLPVGLAAIVLLGLAYSRMLDARLPGAEPIEPRRLAVLPLVNPTAGAEDGHVAQALTEEMIARLSTLEGLEVIGRDSIRGLGDGFHDPVDIARRVRAGSILSGTVRSSHGQLAISLQLIEAQRGSALWSREYRAPANDVQLVHRSIGADVAKALGLPPQAGARLRNDRKETNDPDAYTAYLKGRYFSGRRDRESFDSARQSFEEAIDRDPTFARAWAGLARVYALLGSYSWMPPVEAHRRARSAAEEALNLDDEVAEAHTVLGSVLKDYYWDRHAAERHLRRAIELDPGNALARQWLSEHLWSVGRFADAIAEARRGRELDPLSRPAQLAVGYALYMARRFDDARVEFERLLEREPDFTLTHFYVGLTCVQLHLYADAFRAFERVDESTGYAPESVAGRGVVYAKTGRHDEARRMLAALGALAETQPVSPFYAAVIHIALGEEDRALELLTRAVDGRTWLVSLLGVGPAFDPIRSDPRFQALVGRVGLDGHPIAVSTGGEEVHR